MDASRKPTDQKPGRMGALSRLPVFFALTGKRAVVAGGTPGAAWKVELLAAAGAQVDVYAAQSCEEMMSVAAEASSGTVTIVPRDYTATDFARAAIAVGAFENDEDAEQFAVAARAASVPVNVIDKPAYCDFSFGSIVNRSPLVIGISTDGAAPVFAQAIRAKLEALLPKGFASWAAAAARWRASVKMSGLPFSARRKFWEVFTVYATSNPEIDPTENHFERFIDETKSLGAVVENGSVTLVGAGPGDAELLTLRAVRALQSADVILFDNLVSQEVLDFSRREARKLLVGKTGYGPSCSQHDINKLMVSLAKQGKRVVRLKGGDPLIFSRASEEIEACRAASIAIDTVPGITAAQGAAARLGISLTGRGRVRRLQYVTGHTKEGALPADIDWRSLADPATTTAIYMPVKTLAALVAKAINQGLDPQTPALAIARATRPDQAVIAAAVGELPARLAVADLPGPLLVMIGRVIAAHAGAGLAAATLF